MNLPVESGHREEAIRKRGEVDAFDVIEHLNAVAGLKDVSTLVTKQGSVEFVALLSQFRVDLHFFVEVAGEDGVGIDEIGLVVLLKHADALGLLEGFEGNGLCLDVGAYVCEVEVASSLLEGDGADVFDHSELVVVDGDSQRNRTVDGGR